MKDDQIAAQMKLDAAPFIARAIGQKFKVRVDKNHVVSGVIVEVECVPSYSGRYIVPRWKITMECGYLVENKPRRTFTVRNIPQGN